MFIINNANTSIRFQLKNALFVYYNFCKSIYFQVCKYSIFFFIIFSLTNCSNTRLVYNLAEEFINKEVNYFINVDEKEEIILKKKVTLMVTWHRETMLPIYADYLINIADEIQLNSNNSIYVLKAIDNARFLIEETVIGLTPYISKYLIRHQTADAVEFIKKKIEIRREERLKELDKVNNVLYKKRVKKIKSNFERFFGEITDEQFKLIQDYSRITLSDSKTRLNNRIMKQNAFIQFLKTKPNEEELTIFLNRLLLRGHEIVNPDHLVFSKVWLDRFVELLENMLKISSKKQQEKIITKLRNYAEDFSSTSK